MGNQFLCHIGFKELTDLFSKTKKALILSMPNIFDEVCESLIAFQRSNKIKFIRIILDSSENTYRSGYGEIKAVQKLKDEGIAVYEMKNNFVSFIISDETGYYLFPQSSIVTGEDNVRSNAVMIDPISLIRLKNYLCPDLSESKEDIANQVIEHIQKSKDFAKETIFEFDSVKDFRAEKLDEKKFAEVKETLQKNPPVSPDLQRRIKTYIAKIGYVHLSFEGEKFHVKKVIIPPKALPFKDEEIKKKFETKMKLFNNINENKNFKRYNDLIDEVSAIRHKYLIPVNVRNGMSIIRMENKDAFVSAVEYLKMEISSNKYDLNEILQQEIITSKKRLREELFEFLTINPPEKLKNFKGNLFTDSIKDEVDEILKKVSFPKVEHITKKISLSYYFSDLTFEDFRDKNLIDEIERKNIMTKNDIESIVKINDGFDAKK